MMKTYIIFTSFLLAAGSAVAQENTQQKLTYQQCMDLAQQQLEKAQEALAEEAAALAAGEMPAQNQGVDVDIDDRVKVHINPYGDVADVEVDVDLSLDEDRVPEKPSAAKDCKVRYGIVF